MVSEGSKVARGAFWLTLGWGLSTVISALALIIIARFLGPVNYGIYAAATIVLSLFSISDLSINQAATHYISQMRGKKENFKPYVKVSFLGAFSTGILFYFLLALLSGEIAVYIFQKPYLTPLISIIAYIIFAIAINRVILGILLGLEKTELIAIIAISSAVFRNIFAIILIFYGMEAFGAILGQAIGYFITMGIGIILLLALLRRFSFSSSSIDLLPIAKEMYAYSLPIAAFVFANAIFQQFYNILAARSLSDFAYGNFSAAWVAYGASLIFTSSIAMALFPSLSKLAAIDESIVAFNYGRAIKYASLILLPISVIFVGIPDKLIIFFYGSQYSLAVDLLRMLALSLFLCVIGLGVTPSTLLSLKRTKTLAGIQIISILISYVLITFFQTESSALIYVVAILLMNFLSAVLGYIVMHHDYKARIDLGFTIKALISALISLALIYLTKDLVSNVFVSIILSGFLLAIAYGGLISLTGALNDSDYRSLREYSRAIPIIRPILLAILYYMEKIYYRFRRH